MSQRDGFASGFFVGAILGGITGGILGAVVASRRSNTVEDERQSWLPSDKKAKLGAEESIEMTRRNLEDKIAQLNLAIDDVRQQLGAVNGNGGEF